MLEIVREVIEKSSIIPSLEIKQPIVNHFCNYLYTCLIKMGLRSFVISICHLVYYKCLFLGTIKAFLKQWFCSRFISSLSFR